jgi:hypothetical protein
MIPKHIQDLLDMKFTAADPIPYRVTVKPKPCADCGILATNRIVDISLVQRSDNKFWRRKCSACKLASLDGTEWKTPVEIDYQMRKKDK